MATTDGVDLDRIGESLDRGEIPLWIFNDEALHEVERERIFGEQWLYVGHESEIPVEGDYVVRPAADSEFLVVRKDDGDVGVYFNSCRHRGTQVCRVDKGNTSHFRCPYHGWTYDVRGDLVGVPKKEKAYPDLEPDEWGLLSPRFDTYEGLIFLSVATSGPSLEEYLGEFTWYLDMELGMGEGMEVLGEPHRYELDIDWKARQDNAAGDTYHVNTTHISNFGTFRETEDLDDDILRYTRKAASDGHSTNMLILPPGAEPNLGYPEDISPGAHLDDEQSQVLRRSIVHTGTVFPNFSFVHNTVAPSPDPEDVRGTLSLRKWRPLEAGKIEMWNWFLAPSNSSDQYKEEAYRAGMSNFAPAGTFEQDDLTIWVSTCSPDVAGSTFAQEHDPSLNVRMNIDEPNPEGRKDDDLNPGTWPGEVFNSFFHEGPIRAFYREWYDSLGATEGEEPGQ